MVFFLQQHKGIQFVCESKIWNSYGLVSAIPFGTDITTMEFNVDKNNTFVIIFRPNLPEGIYQDWLLLSHSKMKRHKMIFYSQQETVQLMTQ
jgi:hypothetical protein